ncbi:hypothetical protein DKX38_005383 [Salix brachista]|uniref:Uncharacterized protein n=1 Tax=Salix brachista TaxID=2182728 RepID=A0A5N5N2I4_9ROSI|nr:hypothetical protein DKX38_005383 [Salix brachista]
MLGRYLQRAILCFVKPILILLGEPETVASAASVFVYGLIPLTQRCSNFRWRRLRIVWTDGKMIDFLKLNIGA